MSKVFLSASQDASIYAGETNLNTGLDEILEVGKLQNNISDASAAVRGLIQFDLTDLQGAPTNSRAFLDLKVANATNLFQDELIYIYPVSQSWTEGSGYYSQSPFNSTDGVTWRRYTTASFWDTSGSDYNTTPVVSASVGTSTPDNMLIEVTDLIQPMMSGSVLSSNFGIILKFHDNSEDDSNNVGNIKFFSRNTHTVHVPQLILSWDNQSFVTGSLTQVPRSDVKISPRNLKKTYIHGEKQKIYFTVRDMYPQKVFTNTNKFVNKYYLPSSATYSITDVGAGTTVVSHDDFSKINCDATGSNIVLDTTPLFRGRFYELKLKISLNDEVFYSTPFRFEVT